MKFEHLESAIALNQEEGPSIFLAFGMVQALFEDIRDASGKEIAENPLGDETLPVRLAWLDRVLHNIYTQNHAEFVRGLKQVDKMEAALQADRAELEEIAGAEEKLRTLKTQAEQLEAQLAKAQAAQAAWERLSQECEQKEQELQRLQKVDPAQKQTELNALKEQVNALNRKQGDALQREKDLREQLQKLTDQQTTAAAMEMSLQNQNAELCNSLTEQEAKNQQLKAENDKQVQKLSELQQEFTDLQVKANTARAKSDTYFMTKIQPLQNEKDKAEKDLAQQEIQAKKLEEERKEKQQKWNEKVLQVAQLTEQKKRLEQETREKTEQVEQKTNEIEQEKQKRDALTGQYNAKTRSLGELQDETREMQVNLKKLEEMCTAEQKEKNRLLRLENETKAAHQKKKAEIEERTAELQKENERLSLENGRLTQQVEEKNQGRLRLETINQGLTAQQTVNDREIASLEQQLEELRGKTDKEKIEIRKKQLEDEKQKIKQLRAENELNEKELTKRIEESGKLENAREKQVKALQELKEKLKLLEPFGTDAYTEKLNSLRFQNNALGNARNHLENSIRQIQEAQGRGRQGVPINLPGDMEDLLKDLQKSMNELRKQLLECADSVELEETT